MNGTESEGFTRPDTLRIIADGDWVAVSAADLQAALNLIELPADASRDLVAALNRLARAAGEWT